MVLPIRRHWDKSLLYVKGWKKGALILLLGYSKISKWKTFLIFWYIVWFWTGMWFGIGKGLSYSLMYRVELVRMRNFSLFQFWKFNVNFCRFWMVLCMGRVDHFNSSIVSSWWLDSPFPCGLHFFHFSVRDAFQLLVTTYYVSLTLFDLGCFSDSFPLEESID